MRINSDPKVTSFRGVTGSRKTSLSIHNPESIKSEIKSTAHGLDFARLDKTTVKGGKKRAGKIIYESS